MASSPSIHFELPPAHLFRLPPLPGPGFIPPPAPGSIAYAPPVHIPDSIYWAALDARVPLTIATCYAVTAKLLNKYNRATGKRPWAISKTRPFFVFVVLHNVFLAVYSAWTWWGMLGALRRSIANPFTAGPIATIDSFCRLNGAPGVGNGLYYDDAAGVWHTHASAAANTVPSRDQAGRLWNEGLAFYGWIFYLSKFYEVLDTFIILAKGRFSSTLQTYHHAGAMMCMWAGMRYMSSAIWMFAFVNSGIHAMMYTYYTITAFNIRVPTAIKRTLTSLQITQFLVGISYAMSHSFITYSVPLADEAAPPAAAPSGTMDTLKSYLYGATAENAAATAGAQAGVETAAAAAVASPRYETVPCTATSGETFAIWLNVLYLAPLTYLFVSFFIASYVRRSHAENVGAAANANGSAASRREERKGPVKAPGHVTAAAAALQATASHTGAHAGLANTLVTTANAAAAAEAEVRRRLNNVGTLAEKAGWDAAKGLEEEVYGESRAADEEAAKTSQTKRSAKGRSGQQ